MANDAWKSKYKVVRHYNGHYLVVEHDRHWSINMVCYKTEGGAKRGAKAAFDKINKEFEKILLK